MTPQRNTVRAAVQKFKDGALHTGQDILAVEEPLEIRLVRDSGAQSFKHSISITMRTPGHDFELAAGFLFTESIVHSRGDIQRIEYCVGVRGEPQEYNALSVHLRPDCAFDAARFARHFYTTSSCGVCGKASIEALKVQGVAAIPAGGLRISPEIIGTFGAKLREQQAVFEKTGALHAAGLFDAAGNFVSLREDVGRHNAVDKLIGEQFLADRTPLRDHVLVVSGRASFELVQKALVAGIPLLAAVGAPSSLAVDLAKEYGMSLLGFMRDERFNVYCGAERVAC